MEDKQTEKINIFEDFETRFKRMSEKQAADREARRSRTSRRGQASSVQVSGDSVLLYQSKAAALRRTDRRYHPEGVLRRTIRLVKGLRAAKAEADSRQFMSAENRRQMYMDVVTDAWAPLCNGINNAADTMWEFLCNLWSDFLEIIVFIANLFIKIFYYAASVGLFIWDKFWDLRMWLDVHKRGLLQVFAGAVTTIVVGLILISSMSAYEYSYYGRTLGITKSQQDVYDTIELLGDKLSEAANANISLDVERDIEFKRVYGFGLKIDNKDDILNTLTYMKDMQIRAYGIFINGEQVALLDKEDIASEIIEQVKKDFTPVQEGYEYSSISVAETITIEEVDTVLSALWRPADAVKYIETGSVKQIDESEYEPMVTVYATATITKETETKFKTIYKSNSSLNPGQTRLVREGKPGISRMISLVQMVNGVEVSRVDQASVKVSDPVDAVYERGARSSGGGSSSSSDPSSPRQGTGTWAFPLHGKYTITSRFGKRNTGISGASKNHKGVDLYQPYGSKIYAADGGTVTYAGWKTAKGYTVIIDHGAGYETVYAHCSKILVHVGQQVSQGENIAKIGKSGVASGPHLHFEVHYKGTPFNPLSLF